MYDGRRPRHLKLPITPKTVRTLVGQAAFTIRLTQRALAEEAGVSLRTVERWLAGTSHPSAEQMATLARLVHPKNPALAAQVAAAGGTTLTALGLVAPAPPAPTPLPPVAHRLERVVYAAAEASDLSPRAIRPALVAAFTRAREVGLTLDEAIAALSAGS